MPLASSLGTLSPINFGLASMLNSEETSIAIVQTASPRVGTYKWSYNTGFGTRYSSPSPGVSGNGLCTSFSKTGAAIGVGCATSPFMDFYPFSNAGYGTKYAYTAGNAPSAVNSINFNTPNSAVVLALTGIAAYRWSDSSGFSTAYSGPPVSPTGTQYGAKFSPDNLSVCSAQYGFGTTAYPIAYSWTDASGFGSKYPDPVTAYPNNGAPRGLSYTSDSSCVAVAMSQTTAPSLVVYAWSSLTGWGAKYADPSGLPAGAKYSVTFSNTDTEIIFGGDNSPYIHAYAWSITTGFGTKYANPATTLPGTRLYATTLSKDGKVVFAGMTGIAPYLNAYRWDPGFGTKYTNPKTAVSNTVFSLSSR